MGRVRRRVYVSARVAGGKDDRDESAKEEPEADDLSKLEVRPDGDGGVRQVAPEHHAGRAAAGAAAAVTLAARAVIRPTPSGRQMLAPSMMAQWA